MAFLWLHTLNERLPWLETVGTSVSRLGRALVITSLLVTGGVIGMRYLGLIEAAELAAYDRLLQQQPAADVDDRLLVVGVTENDLQALQEWPLSDRTIAQALEQLTQHQPQVIALDIFRDFPYEPGTSELQTQVQQNPNVLVICKTSAANDPGTPPPPWADAEQVTFADLVVDAGGILRRSLLMAGIYEPDTPFPRPHLCNEPGPTLFSLSFKATLTYLTEQGIEPSFNDDQQLMFGSTLIPQIEANVGGYQGVDAGGYQLMLYYRSKTNAIPQISLMEVLNGDIDPEMIRDRIVMIGYTTPQSKDDFYTPFSSGKDDQQKMPGVVVHAQSASQLLSAVLDGRPLIWTWSAPTEILWIWMWSMLGGILAWYLRHPAIFAFMILLGCVAVYSLCFVAFLQGGWLPLIPAVMTFLGTAVGIVSLDRFNNSAYGQQVYRKVKTFLRLEIDIDHNKVQEQVAEITESDYFQELQETARKLRTTSDSEQSSQEDWPHEQAVQAWQDHALGSDKHAKGLESLLHTTEDAVTQSPSHPSPAGQANEPDDWKTLSQEMQDQDTKAQLSETSPSPSTEHRLLASEGELASLNRANETIGKAKISVSPTAANDADDYGGQYLRAIAQEAQMLKKRTQAAALQASSKSSPASKPLAPVTAHTPFLLDDTYCDYADSSTLTDNYLKQLEQQLTDIKNELLAQ
ncbi:MAG: CHASE2 domain-containing protein [Cyanobacteria bacterium P01_F01_bin.56]